MDGFSHLWLVGPDAWFSQKQQKHGLICPLSFGPSEMSLCPESSAVFLGRVDVQLPPCIMQFYLTFLDAAADSTG